MQNRVSLQLLLFFYLIDVVIVVVDVVVYVHHECENSHYKAAKCKNWKFLKVLIEKYISQYGEFTLRN